LRGMTSWMISVLNWIRLLIFRQLLRDFDFRFAFSGVAPRFVWSDSRSNCHHHMNGGNSQC
jgi:hypothetical protein